MNWIIVAILLLTLAPGCSTCKGLTGTALKLCEAVITPAPDPTPTPVPVEAYTVVQGQRIEKVARSVSFDITPARDGTQELEDVPVWAYVGTDGATWNGGNSLNGLLSVRVKANNTGSYELKVGMNGVVQEPDVSAPCKAGVKVAMKLELLPDEVRFTANGQSKSVPVTLSADQSYTIGIGWPPQKRQGCLGATITNAIWTGKP